MSGVLAANTPVDELWEIVRPALEETLQLVTWTGLITIGVGLPLAVVLHNTSPSGLRPTPVVHLPLNGIVNFARSLPFLILMVLLIPFTRLLVGTTIGVAGSIVPMSVAAIPFAARLLETNLREVPPDVLRVGRASGGSVFGVVSRVQLPEAVPAMIGNLTLLVITIIEISAVAGTLGGGGIGDLAVTYGYTRFDTTVLVACAVILVISVQLVQLVGDLLARRLDHR
ncbi:ABC transporter permease [Pseudonocardia halophobica]|uniref:ABC transporter permease n=1 Tax=Pseudonocardia halophobica TaxID=29401 RepID=A0A9W6L1K1_9PSEU|nr:methionine ABC transporter permease [Pseudonocardia halophobica]GLL10549.1 ABC transporter permease [Pseudonocardia halophobica]